jgi:ribosome biogenesis GTPase A
MGSPRSSAVNFRESSAAPGEGAAVRLAVVPHRDLERLVRRLTMLCEGRAERVLRLSERIDSQRFHIAVLGEFKRGKSTLVNALIGRELLPSGVVPLTTVATEVHFGTGPSTVVFSDGRRLPIGEDEIAQ